jgi:hypothetical protein
VTTIRLILKHCEIPDKRVRRVVIMATFGREKSIYIKANLAGFVCVLLGDGRRLLCSGGVFFGVRSGAQQWGSLFFGARSEDPLVGKCGVFFGVRSGAVAWQRHLHNLKRFLWGLFCSCCWAAAQQVCYHGYAFSSVVHPSNAGYFG